jgi:hypothetical protein
MRKVVGDSPKGKVYRYPHYKRSVSGVCVYTCSANSLEEGGLRPTLDQRLLQNLKKCTDIVYVQFFDGVSRRANGSAVP